MVKKASEKNTELQSVDPFEEKGLFKTIGEVDLSGFESLKTTFVPEHAAFSGFLIREGAPESIDDKAVRTWIIEIEGVKVRIGGSTLLDQQLEAALRTYRSPIKIVVQNNGYKNIGNGRRLAQFNVFAKGDPIE